MKWVFLLFALASNGWATVLYNFVPVAAVGTSLTAITGAEGDWLNISAGSPISTVQNYATWGTPAAQHDGSLNTLSYVSNTKTSYTDGTLTARVSLGMSQLIIVYRAPNTYTNQAGAGGMIPDGGYCLRYAGGWLLQYSNGTAFSASITSSAAAAPGTDATIKIYFNGTTHAAWSGSTLLWSITDATKTTGGGFAYGGYSTGSNRYANITVDDGVSAAATSPRAMHLLKILRMGL